MDCDYFRELLSANRDGELTEQENRVLTAHLQTCLPCRAFADELSALGDALALWRPEPLPSMVKDQILGRTIGHAVNSRTGFLRGYYRIPRSLAWAAILAVVLLLVNTIADPFSAHRQPDAASSPSVGSVRVQKVVLTQKDLVSSYTIVGGDHPSKGGK